MFCGQANAQLNYLQAFDNENHGWTTEDDAFVIDELDFCNGSSAFAGEAYNYFDLFYADAVALSPSLGSSSGMPATLSYNFKVLGSSGIVPGYGSVNVEYATAPSGPWTLIETLDSSTYPALPNCTLHTSQSFSPAASQNFYLRFTVATGPTDDLLLMKFVLDDVTLTQSAAPGCTTTPSASTAVASESVICTTQPVSLSLSPPYAVSGLNFQWQ